MHVMTGSRSDSMGKLTALPQFLELYEGNGMGSREKSKEEEGRKEGGKGEKGREEENRQERRVNFPFLVCGCTPESSNINVTNQ